MKRFIGTSFILFFTLFILRKSVRGGKTIKESSYYLVLLHSLSSPAFLYFTGKKEVFVCVNSCFYDRTARVPLSSQEENVRVLKWFYDKTARVTRNFMKTNDVPFCNKYA